MKSKGIQVSRDICQKHRSNRQRQSSISSNESISRSSSNSMQKTTSYMKRAEKSINSTEITPLSTKKRTPIIGNSKVSAARATSRENLTSHASSSEDLASNAEIVRRPRRSRPKDKLTDT